MRTPALPSPRRIAVGAGLALLVAGLTPISASANPAGTALVISEVYGGGGNTGATYTNDFIELFNPTASAISVDGLSVQWRSATATTAATGVTPLSGSVPAGKHYLVQQAAGTGGTTPLPTPNATGTIAMGASNGTAMLVNGTTAINPGTGVFAGNAAVLDLVGVASNVYEGAVGPGMGNTTSVSRNAAGADTDSNAVDFTAGAPGPQNSGPVAPTALEATAPGDKSGQVGQAITGFTLAASGGTSPYTWAATGLPAGIAVATSGAVSGTPTASGSFSVTATVTDSATPTPATKDVTFAFTITPAAALIPIADIQGTDATTPLAGQSVKTQGVVTASYPTGGLNGFYIQTPGADTPDASDAIFVYGGPSGFTTYPAVGDSVQVTGSAAEFGGATQIVATDSGVTPIAALGTVTPKTTIPGTTCALPGASCDTLVTLASARETMEGELLKPTTSFTVTDSYDGSPYWPGNTNSSGMFGEIGLAAETDRPLVTPTELYDAQNESALIAQRTAYNNARRIVLDDASSANYAVTSTNTGQAFPWLTASHSVRVGAAVTFPQPVIFTEGFNTWRLLPTTRVVGAPTATQPQIEQTRSDNLVPQDVGGDVKLATFNVLNFFPTTGEEFVSSSLGTCTYFRDRDNNAITNNSCNPNGPRGAANPANLERQRDKIVAAINTSGADIVSLEELENSAKYNKDRDFAISHLVNALNVGNAGKWDFAPSPTGADIPALTDEDVIRTGFIYQPEKVALVGTSKILVGSAAFGNARKPLAQVFKQVGTDDADAFAVIVNHFKSKGSGTNDGTGQGNANPDRVNQANALVAFADQFKTDRGVSRVFLAGDFNAYTHEDPIQVLNDAGYANLESSSDPEEESYSFDGQVGSLDHVLANAAALAIVEDVDIWDINGGESVYYEYGRHNSNVTNLYTPTPFRSSDHNPEIVGLNTAPAGPTTTDVQIIGTNDYHGRLAAGPRLAAYVKAARAANPDTVFAAAGDLVGATTFESFIQHDKPTIDVMNEAGLDVSSVGNHEFDAGYDDLVNRIMAPYDATTNPEGGAQWQYLGANVKFKADGSDALEGTWIRDFGDVEVGFIGTVTEDLPSLVAGAGIADIEVTDIVDATNAAATDLKAEGADVVILLTHEGAGGTSLASATTPGTSFGDIVNGVSEDVDAIVSGHTHLAYNHSVPVQAWIDEGRDVTQRPVVSAGQYGENLNRMVFTVDNATGEVQAKTQEIVGFANFPLTGDAATKAIVDDANAKAAVLGAQPLGKVKAGFSRAKFVTGAENRGGESTLNNLVAEVQRWSTDTELAFMNPGGLRADMLGTGTDYPRTVTYKNAADVQPFANTLVKMGLKGSSIKKVLEQQWQRLPNGSVPSRPFLKLGVSDGFEYTYDPTRPEGNRITGMWLNGVAIDADTTYQVAANAFLASGTGDNFFAFTEAIGKRDSGKIDLSAMVDYMATFATDADPLAVNYSQRAVGVSGVASGYTVGQQVTVNLSSLAMTGIGDLKDSSVSVEFDGRSLGDFAVDNTANPAGDANSNDEAGRSTVSFEVPAGTPDGTRQMTVTGASTGTSVSVPIKVAKAGSNVSATVTPGSIKAQTETATIAVEVTSDGPAPTGFVSALVDGTVVGGGELVDGKVDVRVGPFATAGTKEITVSYNGDEANTAGETTVSLVVTAAPVVEKATSTISATVTPASVTVMDDRATVSVTVAKASGTPSGSVVALVDGEVVGAGDLADGKADILLPKFTSVGTKSVEVRYFGDGTTKPATTTASVDVVKAEPRLRVFAPDKVTQGNKATIVVVVRATGFDPSGKVTVKVRGTEVTKRLEDGRVTFNIRLTKPGKNTVKVIYSGDDRTESARAKKNIWVKRG